MRVVIADDSMLVREGLKLLLAEAGVETCASVGDADALEDAVAEHGPDVAIVDIRMPPTYTHEGAKAAISLRRRWPRLGILLLSQSLEHRYAAQLAADHPQHFGYLLKDRVLDVATLVDSLDQIVRGGTFLDPEVVRYLLTRSGTKNRVAALTERERDVLSLMAQGRSNRAIAKTLFLNLKTVESHTASMFDKLDLGVQADDHRRVLAVLAWLQA